jgi:hypothetical protein
MVAPKHAWFILVNSSHRYGPTATRMIVSGALVFSAFHLHDRATKLEQRERSLQQKIGAFARQTQMYEGRAGRPGAMAVSLEKVAESPPAKLAQRSSPLVDDVVHHADYQEIAHPIAVQTTSH